MAFSLSEICCSSFSTAEQKEANIKNQEYFKNLKEKNYEQVEVEVTGKSDDNADPGTSLMSLETEQLLLGKLENFEREQLFTDKKVSLSYVATHIGTNTKYLSFVIKNIKGKILLLISTSSGSIISWINLIQNLCTGNIK